MHREKLPRLFLLVPALAGLLATGCVSHRYDTASAVGAQPQVIDAQLGGAPLQATLHAVIVYHGPGSWKRDAYWDELIVSIANPTERTITLVEARLVDRLGQPFVAGTEPWKTEKRGLAQQKLYQHRGVSFALNTVGYVAYAYGAMGAGFLAGAAATSTWAGAATGVAVGLAAVPVTAVVIHHKNQQKRRIIEDEFQRRRCPLPVALGPGETRRASLFFPMTLSPAELVLSWREGGASGESRLPTPGLAGLHEPDPARK